VGTRATTNSTITTSELGCGGGSDDETNLAALCRECHGKLHGVKWQKMTFSDLIKLAWRKRRLRIRSVEYPNIEVDEEVTDYFIIAAVADALQRHGIANRLVGEFISEAMSEDDDDCFVLIVESWVKISFISPRERVLSGRRSRSTVRSFDPCGRRGSR
jgi:HNH endonuclease